MRFASESKIQVASKQRAPHTGDPRMAKFSLDAILSRPWINKYGAIGILLMLVLILNPELRAFLLVADYIGIDLMIFFIAIQLQFLLPMIPSYVHQIRTFLCRTSYATLRVAVRLIALFLTPSRVTASLTALSFALATNMWCPKLEQSVPQS
jgi:hypothetical protein